NLLENAMKKTVFAGVLLLLLPLVPGGCGNEGVPPLPSVPPVPPVPPSVHFFTFGDWGTGDTNQMAVAEETSSICLIQGCDFGLFLGDNFYTDGVLSVDDPQWKTKYEDVYGDHPSLQIPLYAVLGNHDWDGVANPQAEVDFDLQDKDPYWRMPAYSYSFALPVGPSPLVEVFVINSNLFDVPAQTWLEGALAASTATWKMVAFHHPIFDNGTAHPDDEKGIYPALRPLICGKVDLLLSGHEHIFSHLRDVNDGCGYDQLIVGTGGRTLHSAGTDPRVLYTEANFGVGHFEIKENELRFRFFRATGEEAYSFSWQKEAPPPSGPQGVGDLIHFGDPFSVLMP